MNTNDDFPNPFINPSERIWSESTTDIRSVVDLEHEPVLILNEQLTVFAANASYYQNFKDEPAHTLQKPLFTLREGLWHIPSLMELLKNLVDHDSFFKGFEIAYASDKDIQKVMLVSGRRIYCKEYQNEKLFMLALEDITEMMYIANNLFDTK